MEKKVTAFLVLFACTALFAACHLSTTGKEITDNNVDERSTCSVEIQDKNKTAQKETQAENADVSKENENQEVEQTEQTPEQEA